MPGGPSRQRVRRGGASCGRRTVEVAVRGEPGGSSRQQVRQGGANRDRRSLEAAVGGMPGGSGRQRVRQVGATSGRRSLEAAVGGMPGGPSRLQVRQRSASCGRRSLEAAVRGRPGGSGWQQVGRGGANCGWQALEPSSRWLVAVEAGLSRAWFARWRNRSAVGWCLTTRGNRMAWRSPQAWLVPYPSARRGGTGRAFCVCELVTDGASGVAPRTWHQSPGIPI